MINKKGLVLTFNKFYLPGYKAGGPIRTLVNMSDRLGDEFDFRIVTLDRDAGESSPYPDIRPCQWERQGRATVYYMPPDQLSIASLSRLIREASPDVLYLNSFFDPSFTQRVLWARRFHLIPPIPVILAPRGEFSSGALELKATKKRIYLAVSRLVGVYKGLIWQASSTLEKEDIQKTVPGVPPENIRVAIDLAPALTMESQSKPRQLGDPLRVCFLSRISPMKNLDYALRVLQQVKAKVVFTIYGPKEVPEYWQKCEGLIAQLPPHVSVSWKGVLHPAQVHDELSRHDLFFFPTRGENYGHVIHEALSAGLPVLISDQTPWGEVEQQGVGWCLPLSDLERFAEVIDEVAAWPEETLSKVSEAACSYARKIAEKDTVLEDNRRLFLKVMQAGVS